MPEACLERLRAADLIVARIVSRMFAVIRQGTAVVAALLLVLALRPSEPAVGASSDGLRLEASVLRGPLIGFALLAQHPGEEVTPVVRQFSLTRAGALRVRYPARAASLGELAFRVGAEPGAARRVELRVQHRTASGYELAHVEGARVVLRRSQLRFLSVTLPSGARNPRLRFRGAGVRAFTFPGCRSTALEAYVLRGDGRQDRVSDRVPGRRLRDAGVCRTEGSVNR